MQILRLTADAISTAVAVSVDGKKEKYYNLKHGSIGRSLWRYIMFLSNTCFKYTPGVEEKQLIGNNYSLRAINKKGEFIKDEKGNRLYNIVTDKNSSHYNDLLIFWDIPNFNYTEVSYKLSGNVNLIAEATNGKDRGDIVFTSPAPVLEVLGNCKLEWCGKNSDGKHVSQTIEIVNQKVKINDILTEE